MFKGSLVALITPFTTKGKIDRKALETLVEWHLQEGTDGIVCSGSTGEASTLSDRERLQVAEICIKASAGRVPVIVGTGTADTLQSVRLTQAAQKVGASGCLVLTPYYNKPTQRGCLEHFRQVAKVGLPVIAYHNPGRTAFLLTLESALRLGEIPGIVAIKESSGNLQITKALRGHPQVSILAGDDDMAYSMIQEGATGVISVIGNVIPRGWKKMIDAALAKNWKQAEKLATRYMPLCKGHFLEANPQCVKYVVSQMGRCKPVFRLPLLMPLEATQKALQQLLVRLALPYSSTEAKVTLSTG
ncbi:MAG TPA: 4-hydroxy-tetrahydrodipicolinate synthase [Chlamydiales bacterium]